MARNDLDLVSLSDIAERLDVYWATSFKWWERSRAGKLPVSMPEPLGYVTKHVTPVWDWPDIVAWYNAWKAES